MLAAGIRQQRDMPFRALVKPDTLPRLRGAPLVMRIQLLVALRWQKGSKEGSWLVSLSHYKELNQRSLLSLTELFARKLR